MKNIFCIALVSLLSMVAHAGAESHGGQVVVCPGKEVVMLDYYQATLPTQAGGVPELVDLTKMTADDVLGLVKLRLKNSDLSIPFQHALDLLGPVNSWLEGNLQTVADSDPAFTLAANCDLKQAVVRQESTVYMDPSITSQLSPAQMGILRAHEALYYVAEKNGRTSSIEVRMVLRALLERGNDVVALSKSVHELGNRFFWWEGLSSQFYYGGFNTLKISYDPMTDGVHMNYTLFLKQSAQDPGVTELGTLRCDDEPAGGCRTVSAVHTYLIQNSPDKNSRGDFSSIEVTCPNRKVDLKMTVTSGFDSWGPATSIPGVPPSDVPSPTAFPF